MFWNIIKIRKKIAEASYQEVRPRPTKVTERYAVYKIGNKSQPRYISTAIRIISGLKRVVTIPHGVYWIGRHWTDEGKLVASKEL
jgi:hypothetical protein